MRRDFLFNNGIYFPKIRSIEDYFMDFAVLCFAKHARVIDACDYVYRYNQDSELRSNFERLIRQAVSSFSTMIDYMHEIFSRTDLSPKNRMILETHAMFFLVVERIHHQHSANNIPLERINEILQEMVYQHEAMNPEIIRLLINVISSLLLLIKRGHGSTNDIFVLEKQ